MVRRDRSTRRAVGMFILTMLAAALGRCTDRLNSLGIMVIYLLWDNPMVLGYAGFVFSVGAILALSLIHIWCIQGSFR